MSVMMMTMMMMMTAIMMMGDDGRWVMVVMMAMLMMEDGGEGGGGDEEEEEEHGALSFQNKELISVIFSTRGQANVIASSRIKELLALSHASMAAREESLRRASFLQQWSLMQPSTC